MLVVKTTSPATSPSPAKLHPSNMAPSSRTTTARLRPYSNPRSCPVVYQLSANYSTHDPTRQPAPEIRAVPGPARKRSPVHSPFLQRVYEREVSRSAHGQTTSLPDPPARCARHRFDETRQRELARQDEFRVKDGESSL